jgi:hypothetical protein
MNAQDCSVWKQLVERTATVWKAWAAYIIDEYVGIGNAELPHEGSSMAFDMVAASRALNPNLS